ncbi:disease resistance protein RPM1-like [Typha angustifolia]|uniref:disease resistance protein RPM1-like n=1 Tax=Typha angustifolia TaxID=59011 RepID=UPI003C2F2B58
MWVAEGLVATKRAKTLEEVAEEYLNELIDRCLLQVVERNDFGRVRTYRMHDLVRELAVLTSAKENFCVTYDKSQVRIVDQNVRRMSLDGYSDTIPSTIDISHLRSFYLFDTKSSPPSLISRSARYLRVLDLQNVPIESLPDDVFNLFNLRYLGLRNTKVKELRNSLGKLRRLQTLDLCNTKIKELPNGITELHQLRHLFADKELDSNFRTFHDFSGVQAPKGLWDLRDLQTVQSVEASTELVRQLENLTEMRIFRIRNVKGTHCRELFTSIGKMHFLSNLSVIASDENEHLILEALNCPPSHCLTTFCLQGRLLEEMLRTPLFYAIGVNLKRLWIGWSGLKEDPLPALSFMSNLTFLHLQRAYEGECLSFNVGWFPKLRRLHLIDLPRVKLINIDKTMQELVELWLIALPQLKAAPQGFKFLTSLQEIFLWDMHPDFMKNIQTAAKVKVKHIPFINYLYQNMEGVWTAKVSDP